MIISSKEIKKIRVKLNLSQQRLADIVGVSLRTIQNYENGGTIPKTKYAIFHKLLNQEIQIESKIEEAEVINTTELKIMFVPLVTQYAQAGYLSGYGDEEYIEELPKIPFANDVENKGDYLCFEVKGDSMDNGTYESFLEGDILLCRNINQEHWLNKLHLHRWKDFVIVHKEEGVLVKRIIDHDVDNGIITVHSLNDYYNDYKIHLKDVTKIFNVVDFRRKILRR